MGFFAQYFLGEYYYFCIILSRNALTSADRQLSEQQVEDKTESTANEGESAGERCFRCPSNDSSCCCSDRQHGFNAIIYERGDSREFSPPRTHGRRTKAKLFGAATRTDSEKSGEGPLERESEVTDNNKTSGGKRNHKVFNSPFSLIHSRSDVCAHRQPLTLAASFARPARV